MLPIRHSSIRRLFTPALLFSTCLKVRTKHTPRGAVATATAVARNAAHVDNPAIQSTTYNLELALTVGVVYLAESLASAVKQLN